MAEGAIGLNPLSHEASIAAYEKGSQWLSELNDYLNGNFKFLEEFLDKNLDDVIISPAQTTYLAWLDFSEYFDEDDDLELFFAKNASVLVEADKTFVDLAITNYQTMPITEGELFLGKIFGGVLSFFDYFLFLLLGIFLYFSAVGFDLGALLLGIINFFPMILIPYSILAIILLIIKKFTNVNRHKKLFKNLGYVLMFAIIGVIYYFSFKSGQSGDSFDKFANGMVDAANKNQAVSNIFFQAKLFGLSLKGGVGQRIISTIVLFALAGLISFIAYKLASKFYYKTVFENTVTEETSQKIKKDKKRKPVGLEQKGQVMAMATPINLYHDPYYRSYSTNRIY